MEDWQKDFWEVIETVALGIETFFQEVTKTIEEINEEIDSWKDRGDLEAKALKFKPKLDAMQERVVQGKLAEQENLRKQQQAAAQQYMENVYNTVAAGSYTYPPMPHLIHECQ